MTPRRYIDWSITTPIMLFSTIIFFKYNEVKNTDRPFTAFEFYDKNKDNEDGVDWSDDDDDNGTNDNDDKK